MAAGPVTIREVDFTGIGSRQWQCLKAPITVAETALTAAKLLDDMRAMSADEATVQVIPVAAFDVIQCMMLAAGTADQSPVLDLYGWGEAGPGHHIGTLTTDISTAAMTASTGFLGNSRTHISVRNAFTAATAWKIADQYVVTLDAEQQRFTDGTLNIQYFRALEVPSLTAGDAAAIEANFPKTFNVNFTQSDYSFFGVLPTALDSATSVGLIFRPIRMKEQRFQ